MAVIGAILGLRKLLANDERVRPQTTAYADLDAAVAERVSAVAAGAQREIKKLRALQGYMCAVRPQTVSCR